MLDSNEHLRKAVAMDQAQRGSAWVERWVLEVEIEEGRGVAAGSINGSYRSCGCLRDARCKRQRRARKTCASIVERG